MDLLKDQNELKNPCLYVYCFGCCGRGNVGFAVSRSGSKAGELLGTQQAQDIAALQQSIFDLQQTVKKQSRVIEQLSNGTVTVDEGDTTEPLNSSFAGGEELWAVMEPFVEQHMEDREVRKRE